MKIVKENNKVLVITAFKAYEFETEAQAVNFIYNCKQSKKIARKANQSY